MRNPDRRNYFYYDPSFLILIWDGGSLFGRQIKKEKIFQEKNAAFFHPFRDHKVVKWDLKILWKGYTLSSTLKNLPQTFLLPGTELISSTLKSSSELCITLWSTIFPISDFIRFHSVSGLIILTSQVYYFRFVGTQTHSMLFHAVAR